MVDLATCERPSRSAYDGDHTHFTNDAALYTHAHKHECWNGSLK
jgi:hypothetical protein